MRFNKEPRDLDNVDADLKQFMSITEADVLGAAADEATTPDDDVTIDGVSRDLRDSLNECPLRRLVLGEVPHGRDESLDARGGGFRRKRSCLRMPTSSSSTW